MSERVAVVCPSDRFDMSRAQRFGALEYLVSRSASPFAPDDFMVEVVEGLERMRFDSERDYFALTGPAAQLAMGYAAALCKYGRLKTLVFDARSDNYQVRVVEAPR